MIERKDPTEFENLWDLLQERAALYPERVAMQMWNNNALSDIHTYASLLEKAGVMSKRLKAIGIRNGDRVALIAANSPQWVVMFFALLSLGATAVLIDPKLEREDYIALVGQSDPSLVIMDEECSRKLGDQKEIKAPITNFHLSPSPQEVIHPQDGDASVAAMLFTSGVSGAYKCVPLEHKSLLAAVRSGTDPIRKRVADQVGLLPFTHVFGLVAVLLTGIFSGKKVTLLAQLTSESMLQAMQATHPGSLACVPRVVDLFYGKILEKASRFLPLIRFLSLVREKTGLNLGRWIFSKVHAIFGGQLKLIVSGGAQLDPLVYEGMRGLGFTIVEGYGLTETAGPVTCTEYAHSVKGSVGKVGKDHEIKILPHPGEKEGGEILIRGPSVMKGYFRPPPELSDAVKDGYFHTGDLGRFDPKGHLYITGRLKEIIVTESGEHAIPPEIERHYGSIQGIEEIAVFGAPVAGGTSEEVHAAVIIAKSHKGQENIQEALLKKILAKGNDLLPYKRIVRVHFVEKLPKTATLKVKRRELKKLLLSPTSAPAEMRKQSSQPLDEVERKVLEIVSKIAIANRKMNIDSITLKTSFLDLGFDSLNTLELAMALGKEYHRSFTDQNVEHILTVEDLVAVVKGKLKERGAA